ncbi:RodZ domain-containing protein [Synechococcus sp. CCY9201]|uniref:helix-turn-helix domain-containing protein n=1 Tax=Synechococcus sp. CCY9201 TaxID=174697 RepID=UPI002B20912B|nr:RodZ domain-containing protein [Synechococcus sp. CCY9201]MEA5473881.1 RodZ domain-containing protein [Synechococcus sp. CCY9201]
MTQNPRDSDATASAVSPDGPDAPPDPELILRSMGHQLKQGREARGLTTSALAEELYMRAEQVEALEAGDRAHLPEMVYVIAQARRIAKRLGLDANGVIEPLLDIRPGAHRPARSASSSTVMPQHPVSPSSSAVPQAQVHAGPATPSSPIQSSLTRPAVTGLTSTDPIGATPVGGSPWVGRLLPLAVLLLALLGAGLAWQRWGSGGFKGGDAIPAAGSGSQPAVQAKASSTSLQLSSREPTWLEVKDNKGNSLYRGLFKGSSRFSLGEGLEVLAGRPDLLMVERAGQTAEPLGHINDVLWYRFSAEGQRLEDPS